MLLSHAFGLFTHPDQEWASIKKEHEHPTRLYVTYVVILAAIAPICAYISTAHFGWSVGNERLIKLTEISAYPAQRIDIPCDAGWSVCLGLRH